MANHELSEKDYRVALKAALAINALGDALDSLVGIAEHFLQRGLTQEGANVLAFALIHPDILHDTFDRADELFLRLEEHACPRVIEDAKLFRLSRSLRMVAAYVDEVSQGPVPPAD